MLATISVRFYVRRGYVICALDSLASGKEKVSCGSLGLEPYRRSPVELLGSEIYAIPAGSEPFKP